MATQRSGGQILNQLQLFHLQVEKEKEALRMELNKAKTQVSDAEAAITSQKAQIEKLNHVVQEADAGGYCWAP